MTARKKWRLRLIPTFSEHSVRSEAEAYREIADHRELRAQGLSRIEQVVVLVNEGHGWQTFERVRLGVPSQETASTGGSNHAV